MIQKIAQTARAAARAAGAIQKEWYGGLLNVDLATRNDVKLEVDRLSEKAIVDEIMGAFPGHRILGEEGGESGGDEPYLWIVDPLDGTVNFFHGIPYFCTSIACYRKDSTAKDLPRSSEDLGTPLVGVVYAPLLDEMFLGIAGQGATLNGKPISAGTETELDASVVAVGFGSLDPNIIHMRDVTNALVDRVRKVRCLGAAAYDMANVAAGRLSGYYERGIHTWDLAAAVIIVTEAGGRVQTEEYAEQDWACCTAAPGVFKELTGILGKM